MATNDFKAFTDGARDRTEAYQRLYDAFVAERDLPFNDDYWSDDDHVAFSVLVTAFTTQHPAD